MNPEAVDKGLGLWALLRTESRRQGMLENTIHELQDVLYNSILLES